MPFGTQTHALYWTSLGSQLIGDGPETLSWLPDGSIDLILSRVPTGPDAIESLGRWASRALKLTGSLVLDLSRRPLSDVFATAAILCQQIGFHLVEDFYGRPAPGACSWGPWGRATDPIRIYWWLAKSPTPRPTTGRRWDPDDGSCPIRDACPDCGIADACREAHSHVRYFIARLTAPRGLVVDVSSGTNVSGWVAEQLGRRWISVESNATCALAGLRRFAPGLTETQIRERFGRAPAKKSSPGRPKMIP